MNVEPRSSSPSAIGPGPGIDLTDPRTFAEAVPYAAFAAMRELPGLYWQPTSLATANGGFWAVTRYADIVALEQDTKTFTSTRGTAFPMMNLDPKDPRIAAHLMLNDPPQHSRLRRAATAGFSPRVVANFEPWIREIVIEILDGLEGRQEFDYVKEFSETIPAFVLGRVLGGRKEDRERIVRLVLESFASMQDTEGLDEGESPYERSMAIQSMLGDYAREMQDIKRVHPADDMFTALTGCVDRGEISQEEYLQWMQLTMLAGFETTYTVIGQSMRMYLESPEVAAMTDRAIAEGLTGRVVDEFLRLISPPMQQARTATCDTEFAGQHIRKDDVMVFYLAAANRDPAVYSEPDRFNPWRAETGHLAYGSGAHRCIGFHLANLEIKILWEEIHRRGFKLRLNGAPRRGWSILINQLTSLPVARV